MRKIINAYFIIFILFFVSGCCHIEASHSYKFDKEKKCGLVIVSFTQPFDYVEWHYRGLHEGNSNYYNYNHTMYIRKDALRRFFGIDIVCDDRILIAQIVPEGDYKFYRWESSPLGGGSFSIPFKSIAGKAIYIGNVRMENIVGMRYSLSVINNSNNDIPIFKNHFSNINEADIVVNVSPIISRPK